MSKEKVVNLQDGDDNEAPIELQDFLAEDSMKLDGLNDAIVGVDTKGYLVYDYHKIVDVFTKEPHNMEKFGFLQMKALGAPK